MFPDDLAFCLPTLPATQHQLLLLERQWDFIAEQAQNKLTVYCEYKCFSVLSIDLLYQYSINTWRSKCFPL